MIVTERAPTVCPNDHPLGPMQVLVGWLPCGCQGGTGHRTWECLTCGEVLYGDRHEEQTVGGMTAL